MKKEEEAFEIYPIGLGLSSATSCYPFDSTGCEMSDIPQRNAETIIYLAPSVPSGMRVERESFRENAATSSAEAEIARRHRHHGFQVSDDSAPKVHDDTVACAATMYPTGSFVAGHLWWLPKLLL